METRSPFTENETDPNAVEFTNRADKKPQRNVWNSVAKSLDAQTAGAPLVPVPRDEFIPLSSSQQRLWFIQQSDPENTAGNLAFAWRISGPLNIAALEKAMNLIVQRHEILRTILPSQNGHPFQKILPPEPFSIAVADLEFLPENQRETEAIKRAESIGKKPYDLARGPLLRHQVFRLSKEKHILFLAVHHILFDGTSLGVLFRELHAAYGALVKSKPVCLPDLPIQHADFSVWQQKYLESDLFKKQLGYWTEQLKGRLPVLELPSDHPRPAVQSYRGALHHFHVRKDVVDALDRIRQHEGVTIYALLLAAFKVLLFRYTGQEDLIVGSHMSSRHRTELRNQIGFFVNIHLLRSSIRGDLTFLELLSQVSEKVLSALENQSVPFEKLLEALKPERDASHTSLFQVLFSFQSLPRKAMELEGTKVTPLALDLGVAKFDLSLDINEFNGGLACFFEFNTDLFERETIERMAAHFCTLLDGIAENPRQPISSLPLLPPEERKKILYDWNATETSYPEESCIHELVEQQAAATPDKIAVEFQKTSVTYAELDQRANRLAHYLKIHGAAPGTFVGICIERSPEMVVAMLAVLKSGAAYVPLDPAFPSDRLAFMISDTKMPILLTQERLQNLLPKSETRHILIDVEAEKIAVQPSNSPEKSARPEDIAYILYTSGSTGKPKGVQIYHSAVVNFLISMRHAPGLTPDDALLAITTLSFDITGLEIFLPLVTGARVVIAPREAGADGTALANLIQNSGITVMQATPATWRILLQSGWLGCSRLKILCGGEPLTPDLADALLSRCAELWNLYGPTETTIWSSIIQVRPREPILLGPPIANTQIYILDEQLEPVPIGVPGELCIGGHGVARGYLNRLELTTEKFVPDPFSGRTGARMYRTGDLARFRPDGKIEFLGRKDHQVKVRGYRIELGEIESALAEHPAVRETVVVAREDLPGEKRLVAYVIPKSDSPAVEDLRRFLLSRLPEYMLPSAFVVLKEFPLTPNKKIDRRALPAPDLARPDLKAGYIAPRNQAEQTIAQIWKEVLQLNQVGAKDNFFDLGGHSLLLMKVHAQLRTAFPKEILVVEMFRHPTIESLARFFTEKTEDKPLGKSAATAQSRRAKEKSKATERIAIVGMAGRFPGAKDIDEFWENLRNGVESISRFTDEELLASGVPPEHLRDPNYVKAGTVLENLDRFDAAFFGINPREAELIDPQQRLFLETAWEALEHAGCNPENFAGLIGVFAGASMSTYAWDCGIQEDDSDHGRGFQVFIGNEKDFLSSRVSYKLNLRGPSLGVQSGCSTSLVAVQIACKSLLNGECDMALAGGVAANLADKRGYFYQEGLISSPDGHCRAFDADAQGTVHAMGLGIVVLKRLSDALADGDTIHAVILGAAVNNDGSQKIGYTAPSIDGQSEVISTALELAEVNPETIRYVEAHGTGTRLGDPIEMAALTRAFRSRTDKKQFCAIGSVKANVGHAETAAGVTSLIKTVLALKYQEIPPMLNFKTPNPKIDFASSPFYVNSTLERWESNGNPRRAGVNAFGIGGTNVHVILEEAPAKNSGQKSRPFQLLPISAKTDSALRNAIENLATHLEKNSEISLPDASFTLQTGRNHFEQRCFCLARNPAEAACVLRNPDKILHASGEPRQREIGFLFTASSTELFESCSEFYQHEKMFRATLDRCAEILKSELNCDLRERLFAPEKEFNETSSDVALFSIQYALAKVWMHWGIQPAMLAGIGVGELVAACVAEIFSLEEALLLTVEKSRNPDASSERLKKANLRAPTLKIVSSRTGQTLENSNATDAAYWANALRENSNFSEPVCELLKSDCVFLEFGSRGKISNPGVPNIFPLFPMGEDSGEEQMLKVLGQLWLLGVEIDWAHFYEGEQRLKIPLPTYPFERQRFWVEPKSRASKNAQQRAALVDWFYVPSWKRAASNRAAAESAAQKRASWLLFIDDSGLGSSLARQLRELGQLVATVAIGNAYKKKRNDTYVINPGNAQDYRALFDELAVLGRTPTKIVHLWAVTPERKKNQTCADALSSALDLNFYSLNFLAQTLGEQAANLPIELKIVSNELQDVSGEETLSPEKALLLGPCRAIPQTYKNLKCSSIDVVLPKSSNSAEKFSELLLNEILANEPEAVVAHRGAHRWVETFDRVRILPPQKSALRQNGVYLVTGGLGAIGLAIAEHLAKSVQAKLVLISRSQFPEKIHWTERNGAETATGQIIQTLRKIENSGSEILIVCADVSEERELSAAIEKARARFGKIHGVIHAADAETKRSDSDFSKELFAAKIRGALALENVLRNDNLDFFALCSSTDTISGGVGQAESCAANAFLDAFARRNFSQNVISIDWYPSRKSEAESQPAHLLKFGIRPEEGAEAFARILNCGFPQIIVSPENIESLIERSKPLAADDHELGEKEKNQKYARPKIAAEYVAPRNDTEKMLCEIWQQVLGIEKIGIHDDFFKLGGHSLPALTVFSKIKKQTGREIPLATLLEAPTIEKLAATLGANSTVEKSKGRSNLVVPIKPSGTRTPFFCIHGVGGTVLEYSHLARYLNADQPFYGIQAQGLDGREAWLKSVEEMAARYLEEIKRVQPNGPYKLGGSSFGGLVAFEMAQQLVARGEEVALLAFLDSHGKDYPTPLPGLGKARRGLLQFRSRLDMHWSNLRLMERSEWPGYFREKLGKLPNRLQRKIQKTKQEFRFLFLPRVLRNQFKWTGDSGGDLWHFKLPKSYSQVAEANLKSCLNYRHKPYAGSAVLFRAGKQPDGIYPDATNGWGNLIEGGLEIIEVPGYHGAIVREPLARKLAEKLNLVLSRNGELLEILSEPQQSEFSVK